MQDKAGLAFNLKHKYRYWLGLSYAFRIRFPIKHICVELYRGSAWDNRFPWPLFLHSFISIQPVVQRFCNQWTMLQHSDFRLERVWWFFAWTMHVTIYTIRKEAKIVIRGFLRDKKQLLGGTSIKIQTLLYNFASMNFSACIFRTGRALRYFICEKFL